MTPGRKWDAEQDAWFDGLVDRGALLHNISRIMGRSVDALKARRKARNRIAAGLARTPGGQIKPKDEEDYMLDRQPVVTGDDDRYVRDCLSGGGFSQSRTVHGRRYFAARMASGEVMAWVCP